MKIIFKRVYAFMLDLLISVFAFAVASFISENFHFFDQIEYVSLLYLFHTSLIIVLSKKFTIGEKFANLTCVVDSKRNSTAILLVKNTFYAVFIYLVFSSQNYYEIFIVLFVLTGMSSGIEISPICGI